METRSHGLVDNWLRHIRDIRTRYGAELEAIPDKSEKINRLCELKVREQVLNVGGTTIIQDAWSREQKLTVHGWIYDLGDGLLGGLGVSSRQDLPIRQE